MQMPNNKLLIIKLIRVLLVNVINIWFCYVIIVEQIGNITNARINK